MARPKREFTQHEKNLIARYALNGGKNNTIAMALNMPVNTLTNRFDKLLKKCRAKRKLKLAGYQTRQSKTSSDMAKFLGKNELGQVDKQTITQAPPTAIVMSDAEKQAIKDYIDYKDRQAVIRLHKETG